MVATAAIRAVYEDGRLRLIDPVELAEGQEIRLLILPERDLVRDALGDLVVQNPSDDDGDKIDEAALLREIDAATQGIPPVSDAILEERQEGP